MRTMMTALAVAMICTTSAFAQAAHPIQPAAAPTAEAEATIASASWLAGRWVGQGLGGDVDETWSTAAGAQMVGHFRLVRNGQVVFYEICLLDVVNGGLRMRVKHFNPDFVGWEERDGWHAFDPAATTADELRFDGLTIRRQGADAIQISLPIRYQTGVREETLTLHRAPL